MDSDKIFSEYYPDFNSAMKAATKVGDWNMPAFKRVLDAKIEQQSDERAMELLRFIREGFLIQNVTPFQMWLDGHSSDKDILELFKSGK